MVTDYPTTTTSGRNVLASYLQTSLIKMCRQIAHNGDKKKKIRGQKCELCIQQRAVWLSGSGFYYCAASRYTSQTNSHPCLIKSSIENVFVESKEIFRAENTSADNSRPFVFPKTAALTPTQIASVFVGLEVGKFISNSFFFSPSYFQCLARLWWSFYTAVSRQSNRDPGHTSN